jgi:dUTP pyrophosphatase
MKYVKIESIQKIEDTKIFYLNVDRNHNFFGNKLCLHNCDYYDNEKNEGEIFIKLHNQGQKELVIPKGEAFAQGIFTKYLLVDGDDYTQGENRNGGLGSTTGIK